MYLAIRIGIRVSLRSFPYYVIDKFVIAKDVGVNP